MLRGQWASDFGQCLHCVKGSQTLYPHQAVQSTAEERCGLVNRIFHCHLCHCFVQKEHRDIFQKLDLSFVLGISLMSSVLWLVGIFRLGQPLDYPVHTHAKGRNVRLSQPLNHPEWNLLESGSWILLTFGGRILLYGFSFYFLINIAQNQRI